MTRAEEIAIAHEVKGLLGELEAIPVSSQVRHMVLKLHAKLSHYALLRAADLNATPGEIRPFGGDDKEEPA